MGGALNFRALVDALPQLVWVAGPKGELTWTNQAWTRYTGLRSKQASWTRPLHPDDRERVQGWWQRPPGGGQHHQIECRLRGADGCYRAFAVRATPLGDWTGGWLMNATDIITEERVTPERLRNSERVSRERAAELEALMDAVPAAVWVAHDPDCRQITGNRLAKELASRARGRREPGAELGQFVTRDVPARILAVQRAAARGKQVRNCRVKLVVEGGVVQLYGTAAPLTDGHGQPRGAIAACLDITRQVESHQALEASEARLRTLTEAVPQIVWSTDAAGDVVYVNSRWAEYTGRRPEEGLGPVAWRSVLHPEDLPVVRERWQAALAGGHALECEERLRRWDGVYRWHLGRGVPVRGADEHIVGWIGSLTDIDDEKRVGEALREADRRKDEFLAMLGHELRNPLAPIGSAIAILRHRGMGDQRLAWAREVIGRQVQQISRLVEDLLDVSRISHGTIQLKKQQVVVASVIDRAVETSRPWFDERGHELRVILPPDEIVVDADPARLAQVLSNLLNNSARYTPPGGHVALQVETAPAEVCISVSDDGIGIPPDVLPHVFDIFRQGHTAGEQAQSGLGIGLTLVRRLVELHGGRVRAASGGPGCGSTFTVVLPMAPSLPVAEPVGLPAAADPVAHRRVLVVEDNPDVADSMALVLQMDEHEVRVARDGLAALEMVDHFRPELVLLDLGLPRMDGFEVARRLRRLLGRQVLLAALTGYGRDEDRQRALDAGFDEFILKPVEPAELERLLASASSS